jgi:hypothetical protein
MLRLLQCLTVMVLLKLVLPHFQCFDILASSEQAGLNFFKRGYSKVSGIRKCVSWQSRTFQPALTVRRINDISSETCSLKFWQREDLHHLA